MDKKVELLAPVGNREKLEIAIHYGADAVYLAGKDFSLRNFSGNFTLDEMERALDYAHERSVKVYVACNAFARNHELEAIREYLESLARFAPDALIIADPGVFAIARQSAPHVDIHVSTQANVTSRASAEFWKSMGASRVIVARELPLDEIREIALHSGIEVESFVHGAMCISYSGRCLLSAFMANRDSNRGQCCHPCRWKYQVVEELRPGQYYPVAEDDRGSYIFNSRDLCMLEHMPDLIEAGICSFKIEGRMKGINYLASVVKTYREAIDAYYDNPGTLAAKPGWMEELSRISSRKYCTGFYFGDPREVQPNYENTSPDTIHRFAGKILGARGDLCVLEVRNKIHVGDAVEMLPRRGPAMAETVQELWDMAGQAQDLAQNNTTVLVRFSRTYAPNDLLRMATESSYQYRE
ncbi:MAG: U32 family peptidase [Desulfatibacillum sp.]|nr:U32 family peptidase [Desulfatibacillum sp.]